jgi:hypothetical protein
MALRVEFMNSPRGSWSRSSAVVKKTDGGLFWWSIAITLLIGLATFSWFFCIYVFTHPEKPFNYKLLTKFHKLEPLKAFSEKDAPSGKTLAHRDVYQKFFGFSEDNITQTNSDLHRAYITNYKDERPIYVRGQFKVLHARPLTKSDVFTCGTIARAVAVIEDEKEFRNVVIEYILPSKTPPKDQFQPGDILRLDTPDQTGKHRLFASLLNVQRQQDEAMVFTVVPLAYGDHTKAQAGFSIHGEPPDSLNMEGKWPISEDALGTTPASVALMK